MLGDRPNSHFRLVIEQSSEEVGLDGSPLWNVTVEVRRPDPVKGPMYWTWQDTADLPKVVTPNHIEGGWYSVETIQKELLPALGYDAKILIDPKNRKSNYFGPGFPDASGMKKIVSDSD